MLKLERCVDGSGLVNWWVLGDSYCTVRVIETLLAGVPLTPRTTIVYPPREVVPVVLMVRTAFPVPPDNSVTRLGLRVRVGLVPLLGEMDVVRLTCPAKPPMLVSVRVVLVAEPRVTFMEDGEDVMEKSGAGGGTTLRILVTLWLSLPLAPSIIIV